MTLLLREGPPLEQLTRRLAECPPEFLAAPRLGGTGNVHVAAVVSDLLVDLGGSPLTPEQAGDFQGRNVKNRRQRLSLVLLACCLLHDDWFRRQQLAAPVLALLSTGLAELAGSNPAPSYVSDPDRREELARWCLRGLGLRPAGETQAQAEDRLATLNSSERLRLMAATRAAEQRAQAVREAMARRAQDEANLKAMRE